MSKVKVFKKINVKKKYDTFLDFQTDNQEEMYKNIIDLYLDFQKIKNKNLSIIVKVIIDDAEWTTELIFNRNEYTILKRDILPFFEDIEDYETCNVVKNLFQSFVTPR